MKKGDIIKVDAKVLYVGTGYVSKDIAKVQIGNSELWIDLPKGSVDGRASDVCEDDSFE